MTTPSNLNTWQPPLVSTLNERGPLPKHLTLPYLDELRLVADANQIAVKSISRLAMELKMAKFVGTGTTLFFAFSLVVMYLTVAIGRQTVFVDAELFKLMLPLIAFCLLIRQGSIFLEKK